MPGRMIAIGDIHGCSRALETLLEAIAPRSDDTIVVLGDHINRGPDTRGVLDRLIALGGQCRLIPLLGNHDQTLLDACKGAVQAFSLWLRMGGVATLGSYGEVRKSLSKRDLEKIPQEHLRFLEQCRPYYETEAHIFIHANYDPKLSLDRQPARLLRWESLRERIPGPHQSGKQIIAGHTSQKSGEILDLGHIICVDTYCYGGGWLTALEVQTGQVWGANQSGERRPEGRLERRR